MIALPAAADPTVSILVVSTKDATRLLGCLSAVSCEAPPAVALEVILVLNAAEPGLEAAVERQVEGARVVRSDLQLGFAGGVNLAAEHARGSCLHVLHDDTAVQEGWLEELLAALEGNSKVGVAGSLLLDRDGNVGAAGRVLWRDAHTSLPWLGDPPPLTSFGEQPFPVDYCDSASLLVRRDVWYAIGGLDEQFHPAYYVDVDLAMAVRRYGYTVVCAPRSHVRHDRTSSTSSPTFRRFVAGRNHKRFVGKWRSELGRQAPRGADGAAFESAARATREVAAARVGPEATYAGPAPSTGSADRRERALVRDLDVKTAYIAYLEENAAPAIERLAATEAELAAERERTDALESTLRLVYGGRWWRLRNRILSLRELPSAARRWFSRRATTSRTE